MPRFTLQMVRPASHLHPADWRRIAATVLAGMALAAGPAAAEVSPAVLAAEQRRIETIRRASETAVAIFAGEAGGGSGVLVSPDGYALTNFHVVQPAGVTMQCGLADGRLYDAVLVGLDPTGDVALVKLLGRADFPWAELADSDEVQVGDFCFAAGNPFLLATDLKPSISAGIVSGVRRYQFPAGTILEYTDCLQVDAAINPGNSGGGLFDALGRVIGVNGRASFEKRGRVNVGVGYAISANQLRHFLGMLRGGRLVDHATLGATVATSADGLVVVSDILESSDAWKRGLRYDDEIVSLAGRPVRTVNAFKNVLGTLPAGWRVPLVYRRGGRREEILVRLAGVHTAAELARIVAGQPRDQSERQPPMPVPGDGPPDQVPPGEPAAGDGRERPLPAAVKPFYEQRRGYANYHFNVVERDRVARLLAADGRPAAAGGTWTFSGRLATGEAFRIELSDREGSIDLPTGTTRVDATGELDTNPSPPGSGGMLAALLVWRRLLREGPAAVGRTGYWGTAPLDPAAWTDGPNPPLGDVLESAVAGVEALFTIDGTGDVRLVELWTSPENDPCEIRFGPPADDLPRGVPTSLEVRHGNTTFGLFRIEQATLEHLDETKVGDERTPPPPGGGT
jgi:S1-C subfamily serine protease